MKAIVYTKYEPSEVLHLQGSIVSRNIGEGVSPGRRVSGQMPNSYVDAFGDY